MYRFTLNLGQIDIGATWTFALFVSGIACYAGFFLAYRDGGKGKRAALRAPGPRVSLGRLLIRSGMSVIIILFSLMLAGVLAACVEVVESIITGKRAGIIFSGITLTLFAVLFAVMFFMIWREEESKRNHDKG